MPGHRLKHRRGLGVGGVEVRGLGDFPFGVGDDDPDLFGDGRAVPGVTPANAAQLVLATA